MTFSSNIKSSGANVEPKSTMGEDSVKNAMIGGGKNVRNHPHKIITTSSYDRSLEHLLKIWPDIKKEVPDAELHIFYGWQIFETFYKNNPERMAWKQRVDDLMTQDGITHHGRVSQKEMIEEIEKCGIWAYPTHFGEINCISAMKAQCFGAIPVVINYAALQTTVQYGIKVEGDIYEPEIREEYKKQLIALLKDEKRQKEIREPMMKWARKHFTWRNVSIKWSEEFKK